MPKTTLTTYLFLLSWQKRGGEMLCSRGGILVAEDDPDVRRTLTMILEDEGFSVQSVDDGAQALDAICGEELPCLLVLDLMLPVMSGWEVLAEIQKIDRLASLPVITISGLDESSQVVPPRAITHFRKPVDTIALCRTVARYC